MTNYQSLKLYKAMFLARMVEEKIREYYPQDEMKTPCHLSIGSEAISAGVILALNKNDKIFSTYRNHGHYIAKTGETEFFFAEMYGKNTGNAHGKAGSMHLTSPSHGLMATSAVVATTIPVALGCAFTTKMAAGREMTVSFFGDGALEEGVFWESINFAALKRLPILFVCEDNELAIHTKIEERHSYQKISNIVKEFGIYSDESDSTDVEFIFNLTKKLIKIIKNTSKPAFLHLKYYRYLEHVGINTDFHFNYRSEADYNHWKKIDPISHQRKKLLKKGIPETTLNNLEQKVIKIIEKNIKKAKKAQFPKFKELYHDVYAD